MSLNSTQALPDITTESSSNIIKTIDNVGMSNITCPIILEINNQKQTIPAKINVFINLNDPTLKGIHMSRLYTTIINHFETTTLNEKSLILCLNQLIETHSNTCSQATLELEYILFLKQTSLCSANIGYRSYPIKFKAQLNNNKITFTQEFKITYSSTCPCSAALSRQAIQEQFDKDHPLTQTFSKEAILEWLSKESSINATPHAQRSYADIKITYSPQTALDLSVLVSQAESILGTAVQSVVKRNDEKLFAVKNAQNLMFCEDAIRKLDQWLETNEIFDDYEITVNHHESLHPHNATAKTRKKTKQKLV